MKNNKGITLTVLAITVIVMLLLVSVITVSAIKNYKIMRLRNMYADLQVLTEKVGVYFLEKKTIPMKEKVERPEFLKEEMERNINDNEVYYVLDISKLENLSLNNAKDTYIINEMSHEIYSVKGAKLDGNEYHRLPVEDHKYEPKLYYNIIYELNGGELPEDAPTQYCAGLETELPTPTKNGYGFAGWYITSNLASSSRIDKIGREITGELTLYAKWEIATYDITYVLGEGGKNNSRNPSRYNFQTNITLKDATRDTYIFDGWYLDESYLQPITKISVSSLGVCRDITLYAKWTEAIARIGSTYYRTLQEAIDVTTGASEYVEIVILHNTTESVEVLENQKVSIDLNGCKVTAKLDVAITNEGYLRIKDTNTTGKNGTVLSTTGIAVLNHGVLSIGVNDDVIQASAPVIDGYINGVKSETKDGVTTPLTFGFYDGVIAGRVAVVGEITEVPDGYSAIATKKVEANRELVSLGILGEAVAEVDTYYFMSLREAVEYVESLGELETAKTINLISDCTDNAIINETTKVKINLNGSSMLTQNSTEYIITNNGSLEIVDLSTENKGKLQGGYLIKNTSTGTLTIKELGIEPVFVGIYNEGTANLENGEIKVSDSATTGVKGVQNFGTLNLNNENVVVEKSYNYGIYNEESGTVNNVDTNYSVSDASIGIYNEGTYNFESGNISRDIDYEEYSILHLDWFKLIHNKKGIFTLKEANILYKRLYDDYDICLKYDGNNYNYNYTYEHNVIYNEEGTVILNDVMINTEDYSGTKTIYKDFDINAIKNLTGTVILGTKDGTVDSTKPEINACIDNVDGTLEIYDGIITAKGTLEGGVTTLEDGYILETTVQDELDKKGELTGQVTEITKLAVKSPIASIDSSTYNTIKEAIQAVPEGLETETEITLLKDVRITRDDIIEIPSTKNILLNINGNVLGVNTTIINNGKLTLTDSNTETPGILLMSSEIGIQNNGESYLNLSNIVLRNLKEGKYYSTNSNYKKYNLISIGIKNYGTIETNNAKITAQGRFSIGIQNLENGTLNIELSEIEALAPTNEILSRYYNYKAIESEGKNISINNSIIESQYYGIYINPKDETNKNDVQVSISNSEINCIAKYYNCSYYTYNDNSLIGIYNLGATVNLNNTSIINKCIYKSGSSSYNYLYYSPSYGIYNENNGIINIDGTTTLNICHATNTKSAGIYNNLGTINVKSGTINANMNDKQAYGIYNVSGTVTIGEKGGETSTTNPIISGRNGITNQDTLKFYDGAIRGISKDTVEGKFSEIEENKELVINKEEGYYETILANKEPIARVHEQEYLTLQEAIDACQENTTEQEIIEILKDAILSEIDTCIIPSNKNIKINLKEYDIDIPAGIQNNGKLEIVSGIEKEVTLGESWINKTDYYFEKNADGVLVPTNGGKQGLHNTVANSYIELSLESFTEDVTITVNASISSEGPDCGYATITETTDFPAYNTTNGRFMYISGTTSSVTTPKDYSTTISGGKKYYLHLGYRKDESVDTGEDLLKIYDIKINDESIFTGSIKVIIPFYGSILSSNEKLIRNNENAELKINKTTLTAPTATDNQYIIYNLGTKLDVIGSNLTITTAQNKSFTNIGCIYNENGDVIIDNSKLDNTTISNSSYTNSNYLGINNNTGNIILNNVHINVINYYRCYTTNFRHKKYRWKN